MEAVLGPSISGLRRWRKDWMGLSRFAAANLAVGVKYRDMGDVISHQANAGGFSVVRTYCGHGVHRLFHCPPNIPHYTGNLLSPHCCGLYL
ncbi:unnamed protein product [Dibothriocephalus latus]|uniref:Peptidase M24 domain-containing protein n=1 Tax=Dibothriocephalus latus TaxID=60516 RepID=A0A3P7PML7_DIBLA|nr:unnamed protein product [Dibothriocephalus latus]